MAASAWWHKGHDAWRWWMYGAVFWPVAVLHAIMIEPTGAVRDQQERTEGRVKCPHCAEFIRPAAKVCRFCSRAVAG